MKKEFYNPAAEAALWNEFRGGSLEAFTALYNAHVQALYSYGRKFTADKNALEDTIQDLFIDLWKKRETLGATDSARYYLFAALRHRIFRARQASLKQTSAESFPEEYEFEIILSPESSLINDQTLLEQRTLLDQAIQKLTKRQKEAIYLKFYENLSYDEVAQVMDLEIRSAYNLISKAIESLRRNAHNVLTCLLLMLLL
jgi:RNA polymerase sigma factor (sigma-70 family)